MKIRFENTLTKADVHRHIPHAFEVPPGTTEIHMEFAYSPRFSTDQPFHNQVSLSVADPAGPRGIYYLIRDYGININAAGTTPGFAAGPIQPGRWLVEVDVYRILPPDPVSYSIEITLSDREITEPARSFAKPQRQARGRGWYRGDLHAHSLHSDASWDVPDVVAFGRSRGLDFVSLTDHNTISGLEELESLASDDLLTMGGMELTTFYGHALVQGTRLWHEWRLDTEERPTMPQLAQRAMDTGAFFIIAHPMAPGDPFCSGCHWEYEDMAPGNAPAVEVWNRAWSQYNGQSLQLYYAWLNQGHRLVATGGSDLHRLPGAEIARFGTNVVLADDLTEAEIIAALRRGHSYVSAGPELLLTGETASGVSVMSGDSIGPEGLEISAAWQGAAEDVVLRFIVEGKVKDERPAAGAGRASWAMAAGEAGWCTVELRDGQGGLWALANPIFMDGRTYPARDKGD